MIPGFRRSIQNAGVPILIAFLALSGCYEEEDTTLPAAPEAGLSAAADVPKGASWLVNTSVEAPLEFVSRMTGSDAALIAPGFRHLLERYQESPRMVANRVVQLWQEINEKDETGVDMAQLLDELSMANNKAKVSLGAVIQDYRVLRSQDLDHSSAIKRATQD